MVNGSVQRAFLAQIVLFGGLQISPGGKMAPRRWSSTCLLQVPPFSFFSSFLSLFPQPSLLSPTHATFPLLLALHTPGHFPRGGDMFWCG